MIQYILEVLAFQLLFLVVYDLFLKKETFFNLNRVYLIATSLVSLLIPFIKLSAITAAIPEQYTYVFPAFDGFQEVVLSEEASSGFNYQFEWVHLLYLGMLISFGILLFKLFKINSLLRKGKLTRLENYTKVLLIQSKQAFSFFKYIFLGDDIVEKEHNQIIEHELVHVKQKHSIDLLYFELLRVVFWFNPLVYVYQNRIAELHEFIADAHAIKKNKNEYVNELLSQAFQTENISFVNQFLKPSLLKKRLKMISKQQSKSIFKLKYLFLVPLVFGMLVYNSCERLDNESYDLITESVDGNDDALKNRLLAKFSSMDFETLGYLKKKDKSFKSTFDESEILPKEDFYYSRLLNYTYTKRFFEEKEFDEFELPPSQAYLRFQSYYVQHAVASIDYESYLNDIAFYKVFDKNIKLSISGYSKELLDNSNSKSDYNTITIKVSDTKDFTGEELTQINRSLLNHVKENVANALLVTDGSNTARFTKNISFDDFENSLSNLSKNRNSDNSIRFAIVDQVPIFPGCEDVTDQRACFQEKMQAHIRKNFRYPPEAQAENVQGRVYVNFVIDTDGKISSMKMRSPDERLEKEVERIINRLPEFKPGKQNGQAVNVPFSIPVTFKLRNAEASKKNMTNSLNNNNTEKTSAVEKAYKENYDYNSTSSDEDGNLKDLAMNTPPPPSKDYFTFLKTTEKKKPRAIEAFQEKVIPFAVIEEPPVFPGCENADDKSACFKNMIQKHIAKHFDYPKVLEKERVEGKVYVMFHIGTNGSIEFLKVRGPDKRLEELVKKIIDKLPQFKPGKHKGKPVIVPFTIPITYKLH